jgi:hypothetical protein
VLDEPGPGADGVGPAVAQVLVGLHGPPNEGRVTGVTIAPCTYPRYAEWHWNHPPRRRTDAKGVTA